MQFIIYIAPLITLYLLLRRGVTDGVIRGYLPILLLLPDCYHAMTPGLPDPSFNQAAILPLFLAAIFTQRRDWRLSITDLLVIGFASCVAYSEFSNAGYAEAQNLMFAMLASVIAPYFCARWCLCSQEHDIDTARIFVISCVAVSAISIYQFRFGINLWHLMFGPFFPGQGDGWVTTFRHGFARIAGPYSHAILAGIMLAMAWRMARWLQWGGYWKDNIPPFHLPGTKTQWINGLLILGIVMTIARGPWLGGLVGGVLMWVSHAQDRKKRLQWVLALFLVGGLLGYTLLDQYLTIKPGAIMTQSQESAMYRKELMDKYEAIALEHAVLGWGRNTWPKIGGMESIDNYYLLLALMHGVITLIFLLSIMAWMTIRLSTRGLSEPVGRASLPFTFAGIIAMMFVSLGTVYLGEQPMPAFFFILGWAEAYLQRKPLKPPHSDPLNVSQKVAKSFRHVMH